MMASTTFLLQLQNYPKDSINDEMIDFLQPYFFMEDYNMDMARRVCGDVAGCILMNVIVILIYCWLILDKIICT